MKQTTSQLIYATVAKLYLDIQCELMAPLDHPVSTEPRDTSIHAIRGHPLTVLSFDFLCQHFQGSSYCATPAPVTLCHF